MHRLITQGRGSRNSHGLSRKCVHHQSHDSEIHSICSIDKLKLDVRVIVCNVHVIIYWHRTWDSRQSLLWQLVIFSINKNTRDCLRNIPKRYLYNLLHTWSELLVPLVNMIKEGWVNTCALLILLIFY